MKDEVTKDAYLRNNEYYRRQEEFDYLYQQSVKGRKFKNLVERILNPLNLRLAYRNIKNNKGKNAKGVSGKSLNWISSMLLKVYIIYITMRIINYQPEMIRRVEIPKDNGKVRCLGIKEPIDKIIEQAIYQMLEPIVTAKFHNNSNGFIRGRSAKRALAQMENYIKSEKLYFIVDIDIKGFFDNIDHGKLLKQLWSLGIEDKNLLSIISKMLKAEVLGSGEMTKGTPQGGILSPLLANVVLNELDWWLDSKKNKGIRFVRYADDFKIICPSYQVAKDMLEKVIKWLSSRLKLQVSEEKTKIVNLKRNYSEFLGFKIKVKRKKDTYVIVSHIKDNALTKLEKSAKKRIRQIKKCKNNTNILCKIIERYNSFVVGVHNYYDYATEISYDLSHINWIIENYIMFKLGDVLSFKDCLKSEKLSKKYCRGEKPLFTIRENTLIPIGNVKHNFRKYRGNKINYFDSNTRKCFHKNLQIKNEYMIDKLLENPYMDESVEFNDNIVPVFCGQLGKYKITKEYMFNPDNIKVTKIRTNGSDKYDNIIIVNKQVFKLLNIRGDDIIENMRYSENQNETQLREINRIRKENNLLLI